MMQILQVLQVQMSPHPVIGVSDASNRTMDRIFIAID